MKNEKRIALVMLTAVLLGTRAIVFENLSIQSEILFESIFFVITLISDFKKGGSQFDKLFV